MTGWKTHCIWIYLDVHIEKPCEAAFSHVLLQRLDDDAGRPVLGSVRTQTHDRFITVQHKNKQTWKHIINNISPVSTVIRPYRAAGMAVFLLTGINIYSAKQHSKYNGYFSIFASSGTLLFLATCDCRCSRPLISAVAAEHIITDCQN